MLTFFRDGGWSMFVIVAFGAAGLLTAASHAARPDAAREGFIRWISQALLWATLCGIASDLAAVGQYVSSGKVEAGQMARIVCEGFAESMSPAVMGFALLALIALLAGVGRRRLDAARAP
jgi:hypothetical protein